MSELFDALSAINSEVGINPEYMKERIIQAITSVLKNSYGIEEPLVEFDTDNWGLIIKVDKVVSEFVDDEFTQISLEDALKIDSSVKLGDTVKSSVDTKKFGRIAAQTVRSVVRQGLRDGEKALVAEKLRCYEGELVSAKIVRLNSNTETVLLKIGESETLLPKKDAKLVWPRKEGDFIKVYVSHIETDGYYPVPIVSRSCNELVAKLFENEVPEIQDGLVVIKSVAREPGMRCKIAVASADPEFKEPVGACIGVHGSRIKQVVDELNGEKIDVIPYSDDPVEFITAALAPAKIIGIQVDSGSSNVHNDCSVTVPDDQLSLAIGIKGQNVKLAAKLTGWRINLKPESGFYGDE